MQFSKWTELQQELRNLDHCLETDDAIYMCFPECNMYIVYCISYIICLAT